MALVTIFCNGELIEAFSSYENDVKQLLETSGFKANADGTYTDESGLTAQINTR